MARIGFDMLYYAIITEDANGYEVYGTPKRMTGAVSADMSISKAEGKLEADDTVVESVSEFTSGSISVTVADMTMTAKRELLGATLDSNGVIISCTQDAQALCAIGFRSRNSNGTYRYFWLYRCKFGIPDENFKTKGESVSFQTQSVTATIMRRNKPALTSLNPWKGEVQEGDAGVSSSVISGWFSSVYEPSTAAASASLTALTIAGATLSPAFSADTVIYTGTVSGATGAITATAADGTAVAITVNSASIASGGTADFVVGTNIIRIVCTKSGSDRTYLISLTRS